MTLNLREKVQDSAIPPRISSASTWRTLVLMVTSRNTTKSAGCPAVSANSLVERVTNAYSLSHLSLGQKIKLVIAACLWNNPQVIFKYIRLNRGHRLKI